MKKRGESKTEVESLADGPGAAVAEDGAAGSRHRRPEQPVLLAISSMAMRQMLTVLLPIWESRTGVQVRLESVGGVDAARRLQQGGEEFDLAFLAEDALARLATQGMLRDGVYERLVRSHVGVAVAVGASRPNMESVQALRQAVLAAESVGYSTGPSGVALLQLFERWGIMADMEGRLIQAPPGVPVGRMVAEGMVSLGFQQISELIHVPGIMLLGAMPPGAVIETVFGGAVLAGGRQPDAALALLEFLASPETEAVKLAEGFEPVDGG